VHALRCGVAGCGVGEHVAGAVLVRVLRACACSDWVRLGGAGECVARRSDCSIVAHLLGVRRSHRPGILGAVGASLLTTCALDFLPLAPGRRADHISSSFPLFPHVGAGRVHSWYVVYPYYILICSSFPALAPGSSPQIALNRWS